MDEIISLNQIDEISLETTEENETPMNINEGVVIFSGGGSIDFEEYPVDSGFVKYNAETGLYSTEEIDLSGKADIEYVDTKVADLINSAPETLDTLGELAEALQENDSVVEALNSAIGNKADKTQLENLATTSQVNSKVQKVSYSKDDTLPAGSDAGYFGRVYLRDWSNKDNSVPVALQSFNFTLPIRDSNGNFYVGLPTQDYHTVNRKYLKDNYTNEIANTVYNNTTGKYDATAGLFMFDGGGAGGVFKSTTGGDGADRFRVKKASFKDIEDRTASTYHDAGVNGANHCCPITPANLDYAVKQALTNNKLNGYVYEGVDYSWTDDEKKAVRTLIGATNLNTHANYGVQNNNSGLVMIVKATDDEIANKSTAYKPIVPTNLDYAIVQGLTNNSIILDDTQKSAIQTWLGLGDLNTALETILGV